MGGHDRCRATSLAVGHYSGVTSILTILERSIQPVRLRRPGIADAYELLVRDIENLAVVELDARVGRIAVGFRAAYGTRTPDALQIAACLAHGATAFVTNDRRLRRVTEIEVFILDDFVNP